MTTPAPEPGNEAPALRVLSVEDRPEVQRCVEDMVAQAFAPRTVTVTRTSSATDAVRLIEVSTFDLVISDYELGTTHGGQILDYLRAHRPDDVDRFVFFSGSEEAWSSHAKVIDKGVRVTQFIDQLRRLTQDQIRIAPPPCVSGDAGDASTQTRSDVPSLDDRAIDDQAR